MSGKPPRNRTGFWNWVFQTFTIYDHCDPTDPYLTRYRLITTFWFGVYVHYFHRSDHDRALHDHPWSFISIPLSSGYWEHGDPGPGLPWSTRIERNWCPMFRPLCRQAEWAHRIEIPKPMWTLVLRGPVVRSWGFWTTRGWIHWRHYGREDCL